MSRRKNFYRKVTYLCLIGILLVPLTWLSSPSTVGEDGKKNRPGGKLVSLRSEKGLSQSDLGQLDPASETMKLAVLGMRGPATTWLWHKSLDYHKRHDWARYAATAEQITKLQPNFITAWIHRAWNQSYNIAVEFDDYRDRYAWLIRGINYLRESLSYNTKEHVLFWNIGWFTAEKIGVADEKLEYRVLFSNDEDYHNSLPAELRDYQGRRDNWLTGKRAYIEAVRMADDDDRARKNGAIISARKMGPIMLYPKPPLCQIHYSLTLGEEGKFDEVYQQAWKEALGEWTSFGEERVFSVLEDKYQIRLEDIVDTSQRVAKARRALEDIHPEIQSVVVKQKLDALTPEEKTLLDKRKSIGMTDMSAMMTLQQVFMKLKVEPWDILESIKKIHGEDSETAKKAQLAFENLMAHEEEHGLVESYRGQTNYGGWLNRAQAEAEPESNMLTAHVLLMDAKKRLDSADLVQSRKNFEAAFKLWRNIFDKYPGMSKDLVTGRYVSEYVLMYDRLMEQQYETKLDRKFILWDVLKSNKREALMEDIEKNGPPFDQDSMLPDILKDGALSIEDGKKKNVAAPSEKAPENTPKKEDADNPEKK